MRPHPGRGRPGDLFAERNRDAADPPGQSLDDLVIGRSVVRLPGASVGASTSGRPWTAINGSATIVPLNLQRGTARLGCEHHLPTHGSEGVSEAGQDALPPELGAGVPPLDNLYAA